MAEWFGLESWQDCPCVGHGDGNSRKNFGIDGETGRKLITLEMAKIGATWIQKI